MRNETEIEREKKGDGKRGRGRERKGGRALEREKEKGDRVFRKRELKVGNPPSQFETKKSYQRAGDDDKEPVHFCRTQNLVLLLFRLATLKFPKSASSWNHRNANVFDLKTTEENI